MLLLIAIYIASFFWAMQKAISKIQKSPEFTPLEVAAVRRQMLALLVGVPLVVLFLTLSPLIWDRPSLYTVFIGLILGFAPLAYMAVSSIRNHIAIGGGRSFPVKGAKAVWSGVIGLVFIIFMFTGFAIFFASYFVALK